MGDRTGILYDGRLVHSERQPPNLAMLVKAGPLHVVIAGADALHGLDQ